MIKRDIREVAEDVSFARPVLLIVLVIAHVVNAVAVCLVITNRSPTAIVSLGDLTQLGSGAWRAFGWLTTMLLLLEQMLVTPGWARLNATERRRMDDELVRAHRRIAIKAGFFVFIPLATFGALAAAGGQVIAWWSVASVSASLTTTAVTFAVLELRANG